MSRFCTTTAGAGNVAAAEGTRYATVAYALAGQTSFAAPPAGCRRSALLPCCAMAARIVLAVLVVVGVAAFPLAVAARVGIASARLVRMLW